MVNPQIGIGKKTHTENERWKKHIHTSLGLGIRNIHGKYHDNGSRRNRERYRQTDGRTGRRNAKRLT